MSADWPRFDSKADLASNAKWSAYFAAVYQAIPDDGYPICTSSFTWIYVEAFSDVGMDMVPADCNGGGLADGTYVKHMSACCDPPASVAAFVWSSGNVGNAVPSNSWAEVMHVSFPGDAGAAWYYLAQGSSVWWNVGSTRAFADHPDAVKELLHGQCHDDGSHSDPVPTECELDFKNLYAAAQTSGLDSLQFTDHYDCACGTTGHGSWTPHQSICQTEIIDLHGDGAKGSCASSAYRAGWNAKEDCICDSSKKHTNCKGFGIPHAYLAA